MYMVDVGQHVVPGAVLEGRARAEAALALAELAEADERARAIREEVHHACIEWASAALRRDRIERSRELVGRMVELISARRTVTGEPLAELARLELERARIDRWSAEADADVERARLTLAALLGRDLPGDPPPLGPSLEPVDIQAMERRALASRGLVRASRARREAARARAEAAEAEATIPSFLLRATFMQMPSARPGLGAMIAVDLPWLWGGEGARSEAARAEVRAEEDEIAWREREIRIALARAAADLRRAQRRLAALRERERPAAERALESATIGYAAGRADLIGWLEALGVLRALDLEEAEALAEVAHARAALEAIVGRRTDPGGTR
jgi:outer membrane protein TolC